MIYTEGEVRLVEAELAVGGPEHAWAAVLRAQKVLGLAWFHGE